IASNQQPVASDQISNLQPTSTTTSTVSSLTTNLPTISTPPILQSSSTPIMSNSKPSESISSDKILSDWKDSINPSLVAGNNLDPIKETIKIEPEMIITRPQVSTNEIPSTTPPAPPAPPKTFTRPLSVMEEMELVIEQQRRTQTDSLVTNL
ncbi:hypothetical protein DFH28DRAFT_854026, partial [Melampsora americana]